MGDDIGMWNIGAYHRGLMAGRTPNLERSRKEGMLFTDYYAEASCTAGRANFVTGELPIRTGMTIGRPGRCLGRIACRGLHNRAPRSKRRATPQGSSARIILGTRMSCPAYRAMGSMNSSATSITWTRWKTQHPNYPQNLLDVVGPRNMVHSWATEVDDRHRDAALGQDRQTEDRGRRHALSRADENRG